MTDPAIDRLRSHLLKGGLKDTVITAQDLAGIVQAVRGASRDAQRGLAHAARRLYMIAMHLALEITIVPGTDDLTDQHMAELRAALDEVEAALTSFPSEPLATAPQEAVRGEGPSLDAPKGAAWRVRYVCCGRDDGYQDFATWAEADAARNAYCTGKGVGPNGHDRAAIISEAQPTPPPAPAETQRVAELIAVMHECAHTGTIWRPELKQHFCDAVLAALSAAKAPRGEEEWTQQGIASLSDSHKRLAADLAEAREAIAQAAHWLKTDARAFPLVREWLASPAVRAALGEQG